MPQSRQKPRVARFEEAKKAGVSRIVYLGGMIPEGEELSPHLKSRKEVGDVLLELDGEALGKPDDAKTVIKWILQQ